MQRLSDKQLAIKYHVQHVLPDQFSFNLLSSLCFCITHTSLKTTFSSSFEFVFRREDFQRIGISVTAYLQYQKICSSSLAPYSLRSSSSDRNIQDLDEYSMQKFLNDVVGPITEPAYKRLVS